MAPMRLFLRQRSRLALVLIVLALLIKIVVPQGYMFTTSGKQLVVTLCSGAAGERVTLTIPTSAAPGDSSLAGHDDGAPGKQGKAGADACPFGALGHAMLAGADPVLLAAALLFVLTLGFAPVLSPRPRARPRLSPPLRGPPLAA